MMELKNFNFKRNSLAFEFLIDEIKLTVKDITVIKNFSKYVYNIVGKKYHTEAKNILWCTSKLITLMYYNTDEEIIKEYFNTYNLDKPTTKAFIVGIAKKINQKSDI